MFLATGGELVKAQELDHNEEIEIHLFSMEEVKQMLRENRIIQSMHVTALLWTGEIGELKFKFVVFNQIVLIDDQDFQPDELNSKTDSSQVYFSYYKYTSTNTIRSLRLCMSQGSLKASFNCG